MAFYVPSQYAKARDNWLRLRTSPVLDNRALLIPFPNSFGSFVQSTQYSQSVLRYLSFNAEKLSLSAPAVDIAKVGTEKKVGETGPFN